jgi:hypothetical protein
LAIDLRSRPWRRDNPRVTIKLKYAAVSWTDYGCITRFEDGTEVECWPHETPHYRIVAARLGYGDDILAYSREHDAAHSMLAEWMFDKPSPILWGVAHAAELSGPESVGEEATVQAFQAFLRANQRPILSGLPDIDAWKAQALAMIDAENASLRQAA